MKNNPLYKQDPNLTYYSRLLMLRPEHITNPPNVREFFKLLLNNNFIFHPDDDFTDYFYTNPTEFYKEVQDNLNLLMRKCWKVCKVHKTDIYVISISVLNAHTVKMGYIKNKSK